MSIDRESKDSDAKKVHDIVQKKINFKNYVEKKTQYLLIKARKEINRETFDNGEVKKLEDEVKKLEDKEEIKNAKEKLKKIEDEIEKQKTNGKSLDDISNEIEKTKKELEGKEEKILNEKEKAILNNSNYKNDLAKGRDSIAIGYGAKVDQNAEHGIAIGYMSMSNKKDSIALGSHSVADREQGMAGYDPSTGKNYENGTDPTWKATLGALSIGKKNGNGTQEHTRQITGVAAGTQDTDAVNVAQLKKVVEKVGNSSLTYKANGNGNKTTKLTEGLDFKGDNNIQASVGDSGEVKHTLNKDLKGIKSIENGAPDGAKLEFNKDELKVNNKKLTGLADGKIEKGSTDAVTGNQLHELQEQIGKGKISDKDKDKDKTVTGEEVHKYVKKELEKTNNKITQEIDKSQTVVYTDEDGNKVVKHTDGKWYKKDDIMDNGSTKPNATEIDANKVKLSLVNQDGKTTNPSKLSNVADGEIKKDSKDAVNGGQLHKTKEEIIDKGLNFGADVNDNNSNGAQKLGSKLEIKKGDITDNGTSYKGDNLITKYEKGSDGNGKITVGFKEKPKFKEVTAGDGESKVTIGDAGVKVGNSTYITKDGLNANGKKINNVMDGTEDKDAVNYGQLKKTKKELEDKFKALNSNISGAVAQSMAMANIPQVGDNKLFSIGAASAYYNNQTGFALGISGTEPTNTFIYKVSAGVDTNKQWSVGAGFNLNFGTNKRANINSESFELSNDNKAQIAKIDKENESIKEAIKNLQNENKEMKELIKQILEIKVSTMKIFTLGGYITNKDVITKTQKRELIKIINEINDKHIGRTIDIIGHTDIKGGNKFNLDLGYRRAKKIADILYSLGLSKKITIGKVSSSGMNSMVSNKNKSSNRRVEIIVR